MPNDMNINVDHPDGGLLAQITFCEGETTALVTWRAGKDNDLDAETLRTLANALNTAADAITPDAKGSSNAE